MITHRLLIDVIHHRLVMSGNLASFLILHYPPMQAFLGVHVFRRRNTSDELRAGRLNPDLFTVGHTSIPES